MRRVWILLGLLLVLAAACGGDGAGPDGGGTADGPTQDQYAAEANAVCRAEEERRADPVEPKNAEEFVTALRVQIADIKRLQAALREIEPPDEDREDIEAWLELGAREVKALEDGLPAADEAAKSGDLAATAKAYEPAANEFGELSAEDTFADEYGLTDCADEDAETVE